MKKYSLKHKPPTLKNTGMGGVIEHDNNATVTFKFVGREVTAKKLVDVINKALANIDPNESR